MEARNNLETFSILFLVKSILVLLFSIFPLIYLFLGGITGFVSQFDPAFQNAPFNPAYIFIILGSIGLIFCLTMAVLTFLASRYIKQYKNYTFIFVMAILNCFTGILGITLCVFTLIELNKPYAKELFGRED